MSSFYHNGRTGKKKKKKSDNEHLDEFIFQDSKFPSRGEMVVLRNKCVSSLHACIHT